LRIYEKSENILRKELFMKSAVGVRGFNVSVVTLGTIRGILMMETRDGYGGWASVNLWFPLYGSDIGSIV
jgi:hypothetical protein